MSNHGLRLLGVLAVGSMLSSGPSLAASEAEQVAARASLTATETALARVRDEFERQRSQGALAAGEVAEYRDFVRRLEALVALQRHRLDNLQAPDAAAPNPSLSSALTPGASESVDYSAPMTPPQELDTLDAELDASLADFDDMLLREQESLARRERAATDSELQSAAGTGAVSAGDIAGEDGKEGEGDGTLAQGDGDSERATETAAGQRSEDQQAADASAAGSAGSDGRRSGAADDLGDGSDDDIVARQLREAAEKESDPELKAKLWEEYRKYKQGQNS